MAQRGQELALGEIARSTEDDEDPGLFFGTSGHHAMPLSVAVATLTQPRPGASCRSPPENTGPILAGKCVEPKACGETSGYIEDSRESIFRKGKAFVRGRQRLN